MPSRDIAIEEHDIGASHKAISRSNSKHEPQFSEDISSDSQNRFRASRVKEEIPVAVLFG